jgi:hypothetical protein
MMLVSEADEKEEEEEVEDEDESEQEDDEEMGMRGDRMQSSVRLFKVLLHSNDCGLDPTA